MYIVHASTTSKLQVSITRDDDNSLDEKDTLPYGLDDFDAIASLETFSQGHQCDVEFSFHFLPM